MAVEIRAFDVTVPVGTAIATPLVANLTLPTRIVRQIDIRIPPGPRGEVGFAIGAAGVRVLPINPNAWIVGDNETIVWPLERQIESGAWQVQMYNTGAYAHTLEFRFQLDTVTGPNGEAAPTPGITVAQLNQAAAASGLNASQSVVTPALAPASDNPFLVDLPSALG